MKVKKKISFLLNKSEIGRLKYLLYDNDPNYPKNSLYILSVTVDKDYQRKGISTTLMKKAIGIAKSDGKKLFF